MKSLSDIAAPSRIGRGFGRMLGGLLGRMLAAAPGPIRRGVARWRLERFWRDRAAAEGDLGNAHFERVFADLFGVRRADVVDLALLDVGAGPRGSLEWAEDALERVGLDPAAEAFDAFGARGQAMRYVPAAAEDMPFEDGRFDIVSALNVLDRVDDLDRAIAEIERVLKPGGRLLLLSIVGHRAPGRGGEAATHVIDMDLAERFTGCVVESLSRAPLGASGDVYAAALRPEPMPEEPARAVLWARLRRRGPI